MCNWIWGNSHKKIGLRISIFTWHTYFIWLLYICPLPTFYIANFYFDLAVILSWFENLGANSYKSFSVYNWNLKSKALTFSQKFHFWLDRFTDRFRKNQTIFQVVIDHVLISPSPANQTYQWIQTCTLLCRKTVITK